MPSFGCLSRPGQGGKTHRDHSKTLSIIDEHCLTVASRSFPSSYKPKKAASNVLAACTSSSNRGPIGKSRRRVRSLPDGRFTPENGGSGSGSGGGGGGGGSGASRTSTSSTSSRGGAGRGQNHGSGGGGGGGGNFILRGGLAGGTSSNAGVPESAPRSGSSLVDATRDGGGGDAVAVAVVKRGGNLRWLSPTNLNTASGAGGEVRQRAVSSWVSFYFGACTIQ